MEDASVEPRQSFTDATCDRLTRLVLEVAGGAAAQQSSVELTAELLKISKNDSAFAHWWGSVDNDTVALLIRRIAEESAWLGPLDTASEPALRLRDTASLANRLIALEADFAERLEFKKWQALYNFSYGLSHELNNPLANIATRAGVLAEGEQSQHRLRLLHSIVDNAMRGCDMLGDLMLVARPPKLTRTSVSMVGLIDALAMKTRQWSGASPIYVDVQHSDPDVKAFVDPDALREALWAIVRNGVEAMPAGGRLIICTSLEANGDSAAECKRWWSIVVSDEGSGLSDEALENCFDPYYSGREAGRGLGLGLAKARRLISLHGGRLTITNRPERGCRVTVLLPLAD